MNRQMMFAALTAALGCAGIAAGCGSGDNAPAPTNTDAGSPQASLSASQIDFGPNDCGGAAAADQTITLKNAGPVAMTYTASLDAIQSFTINGPAEGNVAAGGQASIVVSAKAIPNTATAGQAFKGTLTVTTTDPSNAKLTVPIGITAQGATFTMKPSIADFGLVPVGTQAGDIPLTLTNTGNKTIQVAFAAPGNKDFSIAPANGSIDPGKSLAGLVAKYKPSSPAQQAVATSSAITVTGAVCGVPPEGVALAGQGTSGALAYNPGTIDFGNTPCQTQGLAQQFTVANTGNEPFTWNAALTAGGTSPFVVTPQGGVVGPNSSATVTVTPKPLPFPADITANKYGDTISLTTNIAGDSAHTITLKQSAMGAIVAMTTSNTPLDFGKVQVGNVTPQTINVANSGNQDVTVRFWPNDPANNVFSMADAKVAAGANVNAPVAFNPVRLGLSQGQVQFWSTTGANLCAQVYPTPVQQVQATAYDVGTAALAAGGASTWGVGTSNDVYGWGWTAWSAGAGTEAVIPKAPKSTSMTGDLNQDLCQIESGNVACYGWAYWNGNGYRTTVGGVSNATSVVAITGDWTNQASLACAVKNDGTVWCWTWGGSPLAVQVPGLSGVGAISLQGLDEWGNNSPAYLCTVASGGGAVSCGDFVGMGSTIKMTSMGLNAKSISGGGGHTCAVKTDNTVWCWGYGWDGELGDGNYSGNQTPVQATGITTASAVACGTWHSCALTSGGSVYCWGSNGWGNLGTGNYNSYGVPTQVKNTLLTNATALVAGSYHTCALQTGAAGQVYCWGNNGNGQVSLAPGGNINVPTAVAWLSAH